MQKWKSKTCWSAVCLFVVLTLFTIFSENLFLKLNFVCFKSLILCARVVGTCHDKFYPKLLKYFSLTNVIEATFTRCQTFFGVKIYTVIYCNSELVSITSFGGNKFLVRWKKISANWLSYKYHHKTEKNKQNF